TFGSSDKPSWAWWAYTREETPTAALAMAGSDSRVSRTRSPSCACQPSAGYASWMSTDTRSPDTATPRTAPAATRSAPEVGSTMPASSSRTLASLMSPMEESGSRLGRNGQLCQSASRIALRLDLGEVASHRHRANSLQDVCKTEHPAAVCKKTVATKPRRLFHISAGAVFQTALCGECHANSDPGRHAAARAAGLQPAVFGAAARGRFPFPGRYVDHHRRRDRPAQVDHRDPRTGRRADRQGRRGLAIGPGSQPGVPGMQSRTPRPAGLRHDDPVRIAQGRPRVERPPDPRPAPRQDLQMKDAPGRGRQPARGTRLHRLLAARA